MLYNVIKLKRKVNMKKNNIGFIIISFLALGIMIALWFNTSATSEFDCLYMDKEVIRVKKLVTDKIIRDKTTNVRSTYKDTAQSSIYNHSKDIDKSTQAEQGEGMNDTLEAGEFESIDPSI